MNDIAPTGITVRDLQNTIEGEMLNAPEKSGEVLDAIMLGAMCVDPAPLYFGLKQNKAVITRSDRADIQLGALETSIKCLVLTGGKGPIPIVLQRAEEKGVPILVVQNDTADIVAKLEAGLGHLVSASQLSEGEAPESNDESS